MRGYTFHGHFPDELEQHHKGNLQQNHIGTTIKEITSLRGLKSIQFRVPCPVLCRLRRYNKNTSRFFKIFIGANH